MLITYSPGLVMLSLLIAIVSSYVSFGIAGRVANVQNSGHGSLWIIGGGIAMGSGIWAMHFIGMLAMRMQFPVEYDFMVSALSLIVAILFSSLAFVLINNHARKTSTMMGGSLLLGAGIASMHYIGMAAMRMPAEVIYNLPVVLISIATAIFASGFALTRFSRFKNSSFANDIAKKALNAIIMGGGIAAMHYTAMAAATFDAPGTHDAMGIQTGLIISIAIIVFLIQGGGAITVLLDENIAAKGRIIALEKQFTQAQKMEAIGTLVGGIAHDFNNMLSGMLGNLYLAKKELKERPDISKMIDQAEELGMHAAEMVRQLLTFARKDSAEMTGFFLTGSVHDAFHLAKAPYPKKSDAALRLVKRIYLFAAIKRSCNKL